MGEESAGVDAVRISLMRILAGQSEIALVGGANNAERQDMLMLYQFGGHNFTGDYRPVWDRGPRGGIAHGSLGAFLVLEERRHAEARGARAVAKLSATLSDRVSRKPNAVIASLERMWAKLEPSIDAEVCAVISGASGAEPATGEERAFLSARGLPVRAVGSAVGHAFEPQFPMSIALAALAVDRQELFPPLDDSGTENPMERRLRQAVVTGVGHWRGEGMALVEAAD
jgi:3-oxoacyl-[acyl-carrier-protein] synthase II